MTLDPDDFDELAEAGEWDYQWTLGVLMRHKASGTLFVGVESGCSCESFWDNLQADDLVQVDSWQAAIDVIRDAGFTPSEVVDFARLCLNIT